MENERGYTACRDGGLKKGPQVSGSEHNVVIPISCPAGSRPAALVHTHPGGSLDLSPQDIKTMRDKRLPVCIRVGSKMKCYRPKKAA